MKLICRKLFIMILLYLGIFLSLFLFDELSKWEFYLIIGGIILIALAIICMIIRQCKK